MEDKRAIEFRVYDSGMGGFRFLDPYTAKMLDHSIFWDSVKNGEKPAEQRVPFCAIPNVPLFENDLVECTGAPSGKTSKSAKRMIGKVLPDNTGWHICVWYKGEWWAPGAMHYGTLKKVGNIHENNPALLAKHLI